MLNACVLLDVFHLSINLISNLKSDFKLHENFTLSWLFVVLILDAFSGTRGNEFGLGIEKADRHG